MQAMRDATARLGWPAQRVHSESFSAVVAGRDADEAFDVVLARSGRAIRVERDCSVTQALAAEFGPQGVRVNAVLPGAVDTDMYRGMNNTPEAQSFVTNLHALKRVAKPEELARSVLYLASDDSAFVTGTASLVDGGASITRT